MKIMLKKFVMDIDSYTDQEIALAILHRDSIITREYLYRKCYPMFKAIHSKYYTDCETPFELINQIYLYILWPHKDTKISKLESFGFRCSLTIWLKVITEHYCQQLFKKKVNLSETDAEVGNMTIHEEEYISHNTKSLDEDDLRKILAAMPNERYSRLIELHYVKEMSNEETAFELGLTMENYYNCHKRAKAQYCAALRKEGLI